MITEEDEEEIEEVDAFSPIEGPAIVDEFFPSPDPNKSIQSSPDPNNNQSGTMVEEETLKALERTPG